MDSKRFLITPANQLAYQAVEAFLRGDDEFRRVLLVGPRGSGKSSLIRWATTAAPGAPVADPLSPGDLTMLLEDGGPLLAGYSAEAADATEVIEKFRAMGGRTFSLVVEAELTEAVARNLADELGLLIQAEAVRLIVDRLASPVLVRGALHRLRAEAALHGKPEVDSLFALRTLGSFLYPAR